MMYRIVFTLILLVYLAALAFGAVSPDVADYLEGANDKLLHFTEFFVLSILLFVTLKSYDVKFTTLITVIVSILLAVASEIVQLAVKDRSFSYLDMVADAGGIAMGLVLCWVVIWIFFRP